MVRNVTSFTGNGVADWLVQRISAVILAAYTVFLVVWFLLTPEWSYLAWSQLFAAPAFKFFTLLSVLAFVAHAWVGLWTVTTDYIKNALVRVLVQLLVILSLVVLLFVSFSVVWGA
jgi:succinate dehydrogenase / fumarate reductase membrane anchor subunit